MTTPAHRDKLVNLMANYSSKNELKEFVSRGLIQQLLASGAEDGEKVKKEADSKASELITIHNKAMLAEKVADSQADRELKKTYAFWFLWILIGQLIIMNGIFIAVGFGLLQFEEWPLNLYMGGTLAEVFGVIFVITKNLFPKQNQ